MLFGFRSSLLEEKEVQCPQCRLLMKVESPICPHCGHGVTEEELVEGAKIRFAICMTKSHLFGCGSKLVADLLVCVGSGSHDGPG